MPIPNLRNPYDHMEEDEDKDEDDAPEITINAATQIRGHGNIVSIAQMDSVRIANLISSLLTGDPNKASPDSSVHPLTPPSSTARYPATSRTEMRGMKMYPSINITVNCGATIIGDRNIVGPGLGDIARQMQIAQRNQAAQQQQAAQAAQAAAQAQAQAAAMAAAGQGQKMASASTIATPPMSRSSSLHSDAYAKKRKTDDSGEECAAKRAR
ncbi:hypothetical protein GMOD_00002752 [Pyrenophora seminiperda CCB06]|uniref:Uncharacterized protein n=1 Tax=Pyrenophora seminiperda CCB06 TaxID=1302712 RepID=A0A3M7M347_9PLEO|nr:hypothetical protein GMOD_00002752 [Pyrenophora seminiperda CCB06]